MHVLIFKLLAFLSVLFVLFLLFVFVPMPWFSISLSFFARFVFESGLSFLFFSYMVFLANTNVFLEKIKIRLV